MNIQHIREQFPILHQKVHEKPLVYLDSAATSQKPTRVIEKMSEYYKEYNSNVHRGVHNLSEKATKAYEGAREGVRSFLNAYSTKEIVFTKNATEAINLVANSYGLTNIQDGDEVVISHLEHHANIVPWQMLCNKVGATLKVIGMHEDGTLDFDSFLKLLSEKTKFVSLVHVSNALGTIVPVKKYIEEAHKRNIPVLIDGSQAVPHMPVDVTDLDADFYVFTGHKIFGPTGIGVLYGKEKLLEDMPPFLGGGDMIRSVTFEHTEFADLPTKFEAGTPPIAEVIGLHEALKFIEEVEYDSIIAHENELLTYATEKLQTLPGLKIIGTAKEKVSVISFIIENIHPHDIGTFLDMAGVAVRTGHHCTQPIMQYYNVPATARASLSLYNTKEDIDVLVDALHNIHKTFS